MTLHTLRSTKSRSRRRNPRNLKRKSIVAVPRRRRPRGYAGLGGEQAPQRVREDPAVPQVVALARGVEADARREGDRLPVVGLGRHGRLRRLAVLEALDREALAAGQPERLEVL